MSEEADLPSVNWFLYQSKISQPTIEEISNEKKVKNKPTSKTDFKREPVKPPYSYSQLIIMALKSNAGKKLTLNEIFKYISEEFAFYKPSDPKWKNSVRHLLSLDKRFIKVPREKNEKGKGAFWILDPKIADADSPLKPYYSSRRRRSPSNPISKSPKQIEQKDIRPHVNPAVIKLLHVLNKRQQKIQPISSNNNVHHHDYSPNLYSTDYTSYNDKDLWSDHSYYFTHDSSSTSSSPENQEWLIEDLSDACPLGKTHDDFFENFSKNEEKDHRNHCVNPLMNHPWEDTSLHSCANNNNFNDTFDFYDELLC